MPNIPFNTVIAIMAGLCSLTAVSAIATYNDRETKRMEHVQKAIQKGSGPINAGCAFSTLPSTSNVCAIAASTIGTELTTEESDVQ